MEQTDEEWLQVAKNHQEQQDFPKAIDAYLKAIELNPQNIEAWVNLGICYRENRKPELSMMAFVRAVLIRSRETRAWSELAKFYHARHMEGEAAFCKQEAGEKSGAKKVKPVYPPFWDENQRLKNEFYKYKCINCGAELNPQPPTNKNRIIECKKCHYFTWWYLPLEPRED